MIAPALTPRLSAVAIALCLLSSASVSAAPEATDVIGRWRLSGVELGAGGFRGLLTIERRGAALIYRSRIRYESGAEDEDLGAARLEGGALRLESATATHPGLTRALLGFTSGRVTRRRIAQLRPGPFGRSFQGRYEVFGAPFSGGWQRLARDAGASQVELLIDGPEAYPALRKALASARRSIHLQTYIFDDDSTGQSVARMLSEKARAGVEVRVMMDRFGSFGSARLARRMRAAGVDVREVGTVCEGFSNVFSAPSPGRERRGLVNRDHRKIVVVDSEVGFCGGMNIGRDYEERWHDIHATVRGAAVAELQRHFLDRWHAAGGRLPSIAEVTLLTAPRSSGAMAVEVVTALPGVRQDIKRLYLDALKRSRRRFFIENAYVLDDDIIAAAQRAARRGVDVKIIVPSREHSDVPAVDAAMRWIQNDIVSSGIELYSYRGRMTHGKVALSDELWSTVGSSNLDSIAFGATSEVNLSIHDRAFHRAMLERVFVIDLKRSKREKKTRMGLLEGLESRFYHLVRSFL